MRFHHILFQKFRFFCVLLLCVFITGTISAQNKPGEKVMTISVSLKVVDDNGTPIPKAKVVIGEGVIHAETDENGTYSLMVYPDDFVTISAPGYEKNVSLVQEIIKSNTIKLVKSKLFMTSDDDIPLPFMTEKKRHLTGSSNVITGAELEKYPSTDIRNAFTGLATGLQVKEMNGSPGMTAEEKMGTYGITEKVSVSARGLNMMYIIDDIPTDITEMTLDPQEIESVTIVKDIVEKAMFGPLGADGIIYIKTKRGRTNERILNVNLEDGVSVIDRFPGWVSGADYARLNNMARGNDELTPPNYTGDDIDAYAKNDPYDMYHPSINFRDMMLKNTMAFRRANISSSGGNDAVQYSAYLGYDGEGDIYKIGSTADYNRINARSNIDMKINDVIKVQFDISAGLTYRRSPNYGYATSEGSGLMDLLELRSALPNINNTPPIAFPVYANNDPALKDPWYGVSPVYTINPIGAITGNGSYTDSGRRGAAKIAIDYDMASLIPGLKSRTFLGFDVLNLVRIGTAEDYIAYIATPSKTAAGNDTILLKLSHNGVDAPQLRNLHDYYYQRVSLYEKLSYEKTLGIHDIQSSLTYFLYMISKNGIEEPQRTSTTVWNLKYSYNDKYTIQGVLNYTGTYSFDKEHRFGLFPSIGASWIISEESFMSSIKSINFLKIRAQAGIIGYESFISPFLYRDRWTRTTGSNFGPYTSGTKWVGATSESAPYTTYPSRIGNPDLTWEKRKDVSVGVDGLMFNEKLLFELSYFNNLRDGQISQLPNNMPYIAGISAALPNYNYNKTRYSGLEAGVQYTNNSGGFGYTFGGNATVQKSKYVKYGEPDYRFDYQRLTGKSTDTYWGQTYLGKFTSDAEALVVPQIFDAALKEGDLKYKDMNGDGLIDDNDQSAIGNSSPRLYYSLNANFTFRNFELTIIGTGCAFYDIALTNRYFWNGWGDNNYSNFVKDNIGGAYPRLTYYKVNNNFIASNFWLTKGDFFKIQNIELAYHLPANLMQVIRARGVKIFVRGANLLTISKVKDIDPESTASGIDIYPLFRTFTGGIKLTF